MIQRTKNGWQELRVRISESSDFLNWADKVGAFFRVSEPMEMSSANSVRRNLLDVTCTNCIKSALNESRFLSRNPEIFHQIFVFMINIRFI